MKPHSRKRRLDHFRFHSPFQSVDLLFNRHFIPNWSIFREIKDKLGITHCFKKFARQESKVTAIFAKSVNVSLTDNQTESATEREKDEFGANRYDTHSQAFQSTGDKAETVSFPVFLRYITK